MSTKGTTDLESVGRLYTESLEQHGASPMGVGWRDVQSHVLRFAKLETALEGYNRATPLSVNDLGCGYGALYEYLTGQGWQISAYVGYDISNAMLRQAQQRLLGNQVHLVKGSMLCTHSDYSFASGIFNVRLENDETKWIRHIQRTIENMAEFSRIGFAFNMLTSYVDWKEKHLFYGDPLFFFDYCKRHLTSRVSLLHDYPLYEWTILVRK